MEKVIVLVIAVLFVPVFIFILEWVGEHDRQVWNAGEAYTDCVKVHYGMTPQAYLERSGSYPQCP